MSENNNFPKLFQETYGDFLKSIDHFFVDAFKNLHQFGLFAPTIPIQTYETDQEFIIEAELAGINKEQIRLDVFQNHIRIRVKHEEIIETNDENNQIVHKKSTFSARERIVPLPYPVVEKNVKAKFHNGLLQIRIPIRSNSIEIE